MPQKDNWKSRAENILRSEMARKGINTKDLTKLLNKKGNKETVRSVSEKIGRGTFQFSFFLKCMDAMGIEEVKVSE